MTIETNITNKISRFIYLLSEAQEKATPYDNPEYIDIFYVI